MIAGEIGIDDVPERFKSSVEHIMLFHVFRLADNILALPGLSQRRSAIAAVPEKLRESVELKARELYEKRKR